MEWSCCHTIHDLDADLWTKVSNGNPCLSYDFMTIVESLHPRDKFSYLTLHDNDSVVGIAFYYITNPLPSFLRWIKFANILMTGTYETYGCHYWYDNNIISEDDFLEKLWLVIRKERPLAYVIRDYVSNSYSPESFFARRFFRHIAPYSVSILTIPEKCSDIDTYLRTLPKKHRNTYRKIIRERQTQNVWIDEVYDIENHISEFYPLYLNVNKRAKEFKTPPLHISFFLQLQHTFGLNCLCLRLIYSNDTIGFVLIIKGEKEIIPFLMGINYKYRHLHVWHNLTIECINYAIRENYTKIDLGLTNYELKKRLGAKKILINMQARFRNSLVNRLCNPMLDKLL